MTNLKDYECKCNCHDDPYLLDCECCEGRCVACRKNVTYLKGHYEMCPELPAWKKKQKRSKLRQMGFLPSLGY